MLLKASVKQQFHFLIINKYMFRPQYYEIFSLECVENIATGFGRDGWCLSPGKKKRFFSSLSRPALGPSQPPMQWVLGDLSSGIKQP
jgi:hypothetical protein